MQTWQKCREKVIHSKNKEQFLTEYLPSSIGEKDWSQIEIIWWDKCSFGFSASSNSLVNKTGSSEIEPSTLKPVICSSWKHCLRRSWLSSKPWFPQQSSNEEISTIAKELNNAKACVFIINITLLCTQLTVEGMTIILDGLWGVPKKVTQHRSRTACWSWWEVSSTGNDT